MPNVQNFSKFNRFGYFWWKSLRSSSFFLNNFKALIIESCFIFFSFSRSKSFKYLTIGCSALTTFFKFLGFLSRISFSCFFLKWFSYIIFQFKITKKNFLFFFSSFFCHVISNLYLLLLWTFWLSSKFELSYWAFS